MNSARCILLALVSLIGVGTQLNATTIYLGSGATGTNPQIQVLDTSGNFLGNFGANPSSAAALDGAGHVFTVTPGDTSSTIYVYNAAQAELANFLFTSGIDNGNGFANYLTDLTWDGSNLWASSYNGEIYQISSTGTLLSSFNTGIVDTGVTTDGTYLYTTSGLGLLGPASLIYKWDFQGNLVDTIDTGLNDTLGIGYDKSTSTFYVGGVDVVTQVGTNGSVLNTFANDGYHTGLEVGDIGGVPSEVPEPRAVLLMSAGLLAIVQLKWKRGRGFRFLPLLALISLLPVDSRAAVSISSFTGAPGGPVPVGTTLNFTTVASDTDPGAIRYRYRVRFNGGAYSTVVDYGPANAFAWTPSTVEGTYDVEVSALNRATASTQAASATITVTSRVTGSSPVVTPTSNPLVALYSAPPCASGIMRVRFKSAAQSYWQSTNSKPCNGVTSMNFYIAGMYASTTYTMRNDVINGPRVATSTDVTFTTGTTSLSTPPVNVVVPLQTTSAMTEPITLFAPLQQSMTACDKDGKLLWYLPFAGAVASRIMPGYIPAAGVSSDPPPIIDPSVIIIYGLTPTLETSGFKEFDLAGNVLKDTNVEQLNAQLAAMGLTTTINAVHHDVRRLADGSYLMIGMTEVISGVQGGGPDTDILGDVILWLDSNLQLRWFWNGFDHLDVARKAVLNETCSTGQGGCVVLKAAVANDWTHCNSVAIAPDGNIILSSRHQDWVYKIAFQGGTGDGQVIWRLGKDGDFTWNSSEAFPWQSHQHDAEYDGKGNVISLYDNGNTRIGQFGGNSRGQVLRVDETNHTVSILISADLGVFSAAVGSAQKLSNGDYWFGSLWLNDPQSVEVNPSGAIVGHLEKAQPTYRTFRLRDMYSAPW
jgi:arylsulfate sulfotransferase